MALIDEPIPPIPAAIDADPGKVRLGERRFHDPRLSHDNSVACAPCHQLDEESLTARPRNRQQATC